MKLLITGATGFLGGRLANFLLTDPQYQLLLGSRELSYLVNRYQYAELVKTQWYSETELDNICSGVETIIHLAGMNAGQCANASKDGLALDVKATQNLLQAAVKNKVKRFVYLSSAHVYSATLSGSISELTPTTNTHPYALNHRAKETLVMQAHCSGLIEGVVIRLSNAFGVPAQKEANCWMLLVNDLCRQAANSSRLELKSTGQQRRDFVTVTDFCTALQHIIHLPSGALGNGLFNIGGQWAPTVLEMTNYIANRYYKMTGVQPPISHKPYNIEESSELNFMIQKLLNTGYAAGLENSIIIEIDNLIKFCISNKV